MNITVHINSLILDGIDIPPAQRPFLQAAVEGELARMLTVGGLSNDLVSGGARPAVPGGTIQLEYGKNAGRLGTQIARSVYGGIGR